MKPIDRIRVFIVDNPDVSRAAISDGVGIPLPTVKDCLKILREAGELTWKAGPASPRGGRHIVLYSASETMQEAVVDAIEASPCGKAITRQALMSRTPLEQVWSHLRHLHTDGATRYVGNP